MPRVLITGASGRLGQMFLRAKGDRYNLRLTYNSHPFAAPPHEVVQIDLTDMSSVLAAMQGIDTVIHLGAAGDDRNPWEMVLPHNIVGTYNAFEAARQAGVRRFIYASSNHTVGMGAQDSTPLTLDAEIRPTTLYGVSKCFGEAMGRYMHDRYGMHVTCLRIGMCFGDDTPEAQRANIMRFMDGPYRYPYAPLHWAGMWMSHRDWCQLLCCALDTEIDWGVFYGTSDNTPATFDLSETRRVLGYCPEDKVQDLFERPLAELV